MVTHAVTLFIGPVADLPRSGRPSAIVKHRVADALWLGAHGFDGDCQADRRVHGGPDKAVQQYPTRHYAALLQSFPQLQDRLGPGAIGENLACASLDEGDVRVGDVWRLGDALLQLCQPRNPCWKIDAILDCDGVAAQIAATRRNGWYWRVLQPGRVAPGDPLQRVDAADPWLRLDAMLELVQQHRPRLSDLQRLAAAPGIAAHWRDKIEQRIAWLQTQPDAVS